MCLVAGMFGASAATAAAAQAITGLAISAVSTVTGIVSSQQQAKVAAQQAKIQTVNQQRQVELSRRATMLRHMGDVKAQQAATLAYNKQIFYNSEAANRVYMAEQTKLWEASQRAAFRAQEIYARQIGSMGRVLSSGAIGQSVGLLALDSKRQAGFATAEQNATMRSAVAQAGVAMQGASLEQQSANNQAYSRLPAPVQAPQYEAWPVGIGGTQDIGIPTYNWT